MGNASGIPIGEAAALYGLAPSTLRWWEARRVLPEPPRVNGRRVYTEADLRRVGLAYLCSVTGAMPLEQVAVVTNGAGNAEWQRAVIEQAADIENRIGRLRSAHAYLLHLLKCPDDDILAECPHLDGELARHTPRGSVHAGGTEGAAAPPGPVRRPAPGRRLHDEKAFRRDERGRAAGLCAVCAEPVVQPAHGRRRRYCSRACRQRRYRERAARRQVGPPAPQATALPDPGSPR
ncbi:MerR family transcriptional regulator [Nocardiopsis sp. CA-288880]|uniref:helix-turn-helix domain-containing protein n=1 Tax=Nocardiopsis sp. CA-288880 TaxID=3239995 RepID=UPI003D964C38